MKTVKPLTVRQETAAKIEAYILDCIDSEAYEVETNTPAEKLDFLFKTFSKEYGDNVTYYGSVQETFKNWCMGLPSVFNIEFANYNIIKLGKDWGYLKENATEKQEDAFINRYWNSLFMSCIKVGKKYGINIKNY